VFWQPKIRCIDDKKLCATVPQQTQTIFASENAKSPHSFSTHSISGLPRDASTFFTLPQAALTVFRINTAACRRGETWSTGEVLSHLPKSLAERMIGVFVLSCDPPHSTSFSKQSSSGRSSLTLPPYKPQAVPTIVMSSLESTLQQHLWVAQRRSHYTPQAAPTVVMSSLESTL
jgi:hypothetical protein